MTRRWPLLLSLLPLLLGLAVYGQFWRGWAADFETTLGRWFPGSGAQVSGFPYRLEAELAGVSLAHQGGTQLALAVQKLRLNRGPWRPELTVLQGQEVALAAAAAGLSAKVSAASATASLKLVNDANGLQRLGRLSIILPGARGTLAPGGSTAFRAETLELHAREMFGAQSLAEPASPRLPQRGQFVVGATGFAAGQGAPISLAADLIVRGGGRLDDYRRWADGGGSLDLVMTGSDATGEIFKLDASVVPLGASTRLAGTIATVCPLTVQAAMNGTAPPAEQRLRAPITLALETSLPLTGVAALTGLPADLATRARRGQLPACPRLR
ncbi:hypothetical protein [Sandarakinorhabdus sp. AAP62]|uniref:hypothetical protein n=1 Tax=Sandarakinorhabdus sp. AAP62 TaxID=1248916 RepID=UPI0003140CC2|nr:hypothetical protein [Sandarakinorhabdus sp. AAP62]